MNEKKYEINVDPRILELLGPSLYTNIYYVLAELIANAYDADASNVYIILTDTEKIVVEDDGKGMSYTSGEVKKYLEVAAVSRTSESESVTSKGRKKMGRKGIGKLAALSVSDEVIIKTITNSNEKSGFILTKTVPENHELEALKIEDITFEKITGSGTSITMNHPRYKLHKSINTVKKNITRLFPHTDEGFKIHILFEGKSEVIENFDSEIIQDLAAVMLFGEDYHYLEEYFETPYNKKILCKTDSTIEIEMQTEEFLNEFKELEDDIWKDKKIEIKGWIGAYKSTRGRKSNASDFPDNFVSLFANNKMGEFNVLSSVGRNELNEVYLVGQLHVDIFEKTELPDMALSNRQGYVSDDPRYQIVIKYIREKIMPEILALRKRYSEFKKSNSESQKKIKNMKEEQELKTSVEHFKNEVSRNVSSKFQQRFSLDETESKEVEEILNKEINDNFFDVGLKREVDLNKKKILISQTKADKDLSDVIYKMLCFNGVPKEDIIYSNSDDSEAMIPILEHDIDNIFDYLRTFFVDSISTQSIYVVFVTSHDLEGSWGALVELGASWVTKSDYKIFNIKNFQPKEPMIRQGLTWHNSYRNESGEVCIDSTSVELFINQIFELCRDLGYQRRSYGENVRELNRVIEIVNENKPGNIEYKKFKKLPVQVEAYQTDVRKYIDTLEGRMRADIGDWIVTGVDGEQYPVKPDIFEKTYEELK